VAQCDGSRHPPRIGRTHSPAYLPCPAIQVNHVLSPHCWLVSGVVVLFFEPSALDRAQLRWEGGADRLVWRLGGPVTRCVGSRHSPGIHYACPEVGGRGAWTCGRVLGGCERPALVPSELPARAGAAVMLLPRGRHLYGGGAVMHLVGSREPPPRPACRPYRCSCPVASSMSRQRAGAPRMGPRLALPLYLMLRGMFLFFPRQLTNGSLYTRGGRVRCK